MTFDFGCRPVVALFTKAHPITQAAQRGTAAPDLNDGEIRRNPGEPSREQAETDSYKKPLLRLNGLSIRVENPAGSVRRGRGWETRMKYDYGEIVGSMGVDADPVDVYIGPNPDAPMVYVVHQRKRGDWSAYDEDKACVGFNSQEDAAAAYLQHYNDPRFLGPITAMPIDEFKQKVRATKKEPAMIKGMVIFLKAHVRAHTRRLSSGKVVTVDPYETKVVSRGDAGSGSGQLDMFGSAEKKAPSTDQRKKFYVTMIREPGPRQKVAWLAGPFDRHEDALAHVEPARKKANELDGWSEFDAFGTTGMTAAKHPPGVLNELLGVGTKEKPEPKIIFPKKSSEKVDDYSKKINNDSESDKSGGAMKIEYTNSIKKTFINPNRAPRKFLEEMDKHGVDLMEFRNSWTGASFVITRQGVQDIIAGRERDGHIFKVVPETPDEILYEMDAHGVDEITIKEEFGNSITYRRNSGAYLIPAWETKSEAQIMREKEKAAELARLGRMFSRDGN